MRMKSASAATEDKADKSRAERRLTWLHKLHWLVLYTTVLLFTIEQDLLLTVGVTTGKRWYPWQTLRLVNILAGSQAPGFWSFCLVSVACHVGALFVWLFTIVVFCLSVSIW